METPTPPADALRFASRLTAVRGAACGRFPSLIPTLARVPLSASLRVAPHASRHNRHRRGLEVLAERVQGPGRVDPVARLSGRAVPGLELNRRGAREPGRRWHEP